MTFSIAELERINILRGLEHRVLNALVGVLTRQSWQDGDRIIRQGTSSTGVYMLISGHVRIERRLLGGGTVGLVTLGPGGSFGMTAAIDGGPAPHDCLAWGPVHCACFSIPDFSTMMTGDSPPAVHFQLSVMRTMLNDTRDTTRRLAELATLPPIDIEDAGDILEVVT